MADCKDKIRKLLALAESPEEAEAKAALLRARELMAKHKLTEADLEDVAKQDVRDVQTDVTCSKRRDEWGLVLAMPQEVQEAAQGLRKCSFRPRSADSIDPETYAQGYAQGKEFDPAHRLRAGRAV